MKNFITAKTYKLDTYDNKVTASHELSSIKINLAYVISIETYPLEIFYSCPIVPVVVTVDKITRTEQYIVNLKDIQSEYDVWC